MLIATRAHQPYSVPVASVVHLGICQGKIGNLRLQLLQLRKLTGEILKNVMHRTSLIKHSSPERVHHIPEC